MLVLIDANDNCAEGGSWRFNELEPPRPVSRVRLYDAAPAGSWFEVVGWSGDPDRPVCGAMMRKIDDSGSGVAWLITGGEWGVRLKPVDDRSEWSLRNRRQRGEPYLIVPSINDVEPAEQTRSGRSEGHEIN
ncbi:MAG TPA: hypothetical protein VEI24_07205 [Nitrospiria bacterium]|nr:hypothetical protein [Nitrospiria bacterium]